MAAPYAGIVASAAGFIVQYPRFTPRFELLRDGGSPRAARMLKWLGGLTASAIVATIVRFATK